MSITLRKTQIVFTEVSNSKTEYIKIVQFLPQLFITSCQEYVGHGKRNKAECLYSMNKFQVNDFLN